MKLADEWRQAWKWFTVQLGIIIAVAPEIYEQTRQMLDGWLPPAVFHHMMALLGILVILNTVKKKQSAA